MIPVILSVYHDEKDYVAKRRSVNIIMNREAEILEALQKSVLEYELQAAEMWVKRAMGEKIDPVKVANTVTGAIRQVGDLFGRCEIFLPELTAAAEVVKRVMPVIEEGLKKVGKNREVLGILVIGTIEGDIHDIGKNIVAAQFEVTGFKVVDLGVDVPAEKFLEAVRDYEADLLGLSALLSTTAPQQRAVIEGLKKVGIRDKVKVIVGGGAITQHFADQIGADGYGANASEAIEVGMGLLKTKYKEGDK